MLEGLSSTTVRRTEMITWLLLVTLFCKSTQGGHADGNSALHCEPWNLVLTRHKQTISLTWEDATSCSAINGTLVYELQVLIHGADRPKHYDEVTVTPDQIGRVHSWSWKSRVALECFSHLVKIRSRYESHTSSWKLERLQVLAEKNDLKAAIFPQDEVYNVNSYVTFCCILPVGTQLQTLYVQGYKSYDTIMIRNQTYALTVHLKDPSTRSCANVYCVTDRDRVEGACVYVDNPPDDKNLQCETRDLKSVECRWTVGNNVNLGETQRNYSLQGRKCKDGHLGSCSVPLISTETTWTLVIENKLGKVKLTDKADMMTRVHMFAPDKVEVSPVNVRNVRLTWKWSNHSYDSLNITCQVNVSSRDTYVLSTDFGDSTVLNNLIPNWWYNATVRCATGTHFWNWGDWSPSVSFQTKGDVPDPLDVWMRMKQNQVIITWKKLLDNESHGDILDYTVTWAKTTAPEQQNSTTVTHSPVKLCLNTSEEYTVQVSARNTDGNSSASTLIIPPWNPDRTRVNTSWINGSSGGFALRWSASLNATCGYIVDWCPTLGDCNVEWIKVLPHETTSSLVSKNFKPGLRYTLSIYACTKGSPLLLERREGYVQEQRIEDNLFKHLNLKPYDNEVEARWDPIRLPKQPAFIRGYILYWSGSKNQNVFSVKTGHPEATSLTATNLAVDSYTFTVKALTAVGECGTTVRTITLNSQTDNQIKVIAMSLVTISTLLLLLTILCYRHWACIKRKVYPPIPTPVLRDKWLSSPGEHTRCPLYGDQSLRSEADIVDVPELHCKASAPVNPFVSQKNVSFINTQTPEGYYNQPLKIHTPPSQSVLQPSSSTSVFPNLSYKLTMQPGRQQPSSELQLHEGSSLESSSGGYQRQCLTGSHNPAGPLPCNSTYVLLPQS